MKVRINPSIFREYDIRGVVGPDLTPDVAEAIARAYATYLRSRLPDPGSRIPVVVGRDNRESSPWIRDAVVRGLRTSGCDVVDIGTVITPVFYFARVHYGIDGGVMITASHNPPEFNGFKLAHGFGTIYGDEIQAVRRLADAGETISGNGTLEERDVVPAYRKMLRQKVTLGPRRLRVVLDCGNGTASLIAPQVLEDFGVDLVRLYSDSDPRFPHHHPDPVQPENLRDLIVTVRREHADVGIGLDGDGDRIGVVDDRGEIIWGDILMILFWREILPKHPGEVGIVDHFLAVGVGDDLAVDAIEHVAFELAADLLAAALHGVPAGMLPEHQRRGDADVLGPHDLVGAPILQHAVLVDARLVRVLSNTQDMLSKLLADVPHYHVTPEVRVDCPDQVKFDIVRQVTEDFKRAYEVVDVDGARVLFGDGWGLIRASNTQPALVLRGEARTPATLGRIKDTLEQELNKFPQVGSITW